METLGRHIIAELDGCDTSILSDSMAIRRFVLEAAREAGATVLAVESFDFQNGGVSGFVLLAESHISIHTWPEHGYAAIDIYTCGGHTMPDAASDYLASRLGATRVHLTAIDRGLPGRGDVHEHRISPFGRRRVAPALLKLNNSA